MEMVLQRQEQTGLSTLSLLVRLAVGGVFLYASLNKIADPVGFARAIHNYHMMPVELLHPMALLLPWLEAVIGAALILGFCRRGAALVATVLTVIFLTAVGSALLRNLDISCGCFHTDGGASVGTSLLFRDLVLLAGCLFLLLIRADRFSVDALRRRTA